MMTLDDIAIRALGVFPTAKIDRACAEEEIIVLTFDTPLNIGEWRNPIAGISLNPWPYEEGFDVDMIYFEEVRDNDMIGNLRYANNELIRRVHHASAHQRMAGGGPGRRRAHAEGTSAPRGPSSPVLLMSRLDLHVKAVFEQDDARMNHPV